MPRMMKMRMTSMQKCLVERMSVMTLLSFPFAVRSSSAELSSLSSMASMMGACRFTSSSISSSGLATDPADACAPERVVGDDARRLVTLREELAWARGALDNRLQHLRRLRRDAAWEDDARNLARDVLR